MKKNKSNSTTPYIKKLRRTRYVYKNYMNVYTNTYLLQMYVYSVMCV